MSEQWSFFRRLLEQVMAIQQDYAAGKYPDYEDLSARLDEAARERDDEWNRRTLPADTVSALRAGAEALRVQTRVRIFRAASNGESGEIDVSGMIDECNKYAALLTAMAEKGKG